MKRHFNNVILMFLMIKTRINFRCVELKQRYLAIFMG